MKLILALFENKEEAVMLLTSLETQSFKIPKKKLVKGLDCDCTISIVQNWLLSDFGNA